MFAATANEIQKRTIGFFTLLGNFDAIDVFTLLSEQIRFVISKCRKNIAFQKKSEKRIQAKGTGKPGRKKVLCSVDLSA